MQVLANPTRFLAIQGAVQPWLWAATVILFAVGLYLGLVSAPADYQQGETVRIMFVHVPAAWMALFVYTLMAAASAVGIVFRHPLADVAAKTAAPIGAAFTFLALATGSPWGKQSRNRRARRASPPSWRWSGSSTCRSSSSRSTGGTPCISRRAC